jgi:hypothetical protein
VAPDAVNAEHQQREDEPLAQVGDREDVPNAVEEVLDH